MSAKMAANDPNIAPTPMEMAVAINREKSITSSVGLIKARPIVNVIHNTNAIASAVRHGNQPDLANMNPMRRASSAPRTARNRAVGTYTPYR
jgi:hypothetical protein